MNFAKDVSIIIPVFNEEKGIEKVLSKIDTNKFEVIVVNDGSTDRTPDIVKRFNVVLVNHPKNLGKRFALETGYKIASKEIILTMDGDNTYQPHDISRMLKEFFNNNVDMIIGSRFLKKTTGMSKLRLFGNIIFSFLVSLLARKRITDVSSGMRVFRKIWILNFEGMNSKNLEYEVELTTRALLRGFSILEVPISYSSRIGKSKLRIIDGFRFLIAITKAWLEELLVMKNNQNSKFFSHIQ